jgi:hypothetical protein
MSCKSGLFERFGRPNRTQEAAGSSPASSTRGTPANAGVLVFGPSIDRSKFWLRGRRNGPKRAKTPIVSAQAAWRPWASGRCLGARAQHVVPIVLIDRPSRPPPSWWWGRSSSATFGPARMATHRISGNNFLMTTMCFSAEMPRCAAAEAGVRVDAVPLRKYRERAPGGRRQIHPLRGRCPDAPPQPQRTRLGRNAQFVNFRTRAARMKGHLR